MDDLGLQQEEDVCRKNGIDFLSLPIIDRSVPALDSNTIDLLERIETALAQWKKITVHCRQGIGRSALIAASLLVAKGISPAAAVEQIGKARHAMVPETTEQRAWIDTFAATLSPVGQRPRK